MTFGPIDFIAVEFPGNRFRGEILPNCWSWSTRGSSASSTWSSS